jgi:hypothetical protein
MRKRFPFMVFNIRDQVRSSARQSSSLPGVKFSTTIINFMSEGSPYRLTERACIFNGS